MVQARQVLAPQSVALSNTVRARVHPSRALSPPLFMGSLPPSYRVKSINFGGPPKSWTFVLGDTQNQVSCFAHGPAFQTQTFTQLICRADECVVWPCTHADLNLEATLTDSSAPFDVKLRGNMQGEYR